MHAASRGAANSCAMHGPRPFPDRAMNVRYPLAPVSCTSRARMDRARVARTSRTSSLQVWDVKEAGP